MCKTTTSSHLVSAVEESKHIRNLTASSLQHSRKNTPTDMYGNQYDSLTTSRNQTANDLVWDDKEQDEEEDDQLELLCQAFVETGHIQDLLVDFDAMQEQQQQEEEDIKTTSLPTMNREMNLNQQQSQQPPQQQNRLAEHFSSNSSSSIIDDEDRHKKELLQLYHGQNQKFLQRTAKNIQDEQLSSCKSNLFPSQRNMIKSLITTNIKENKSNIQPPLFRSSTITRSRQLKPIIDDDWSISSSTTGKSKTSTSDSFPKKMRNDKKLEETRDDDDDEEYEHYHQTSSSSSSSSSSWTKQEDEDTTNCSSPYTTRSNPSSFVTSDDCLSATSEWSSWTLNNPNCSSTSPFSSFSSPSFSSPSPLGKRKSNKDTKDQYVVNDFDTKRQRNCLLRGSNFNTMNSLEEQETAVDIENNAMSQLNEDEQMKQDKRQRRKQHKYRYMKREKKYIKRYIHDLEDEKAAFIEIFKKEYELELANNKHQEGDCPSPFMMFNQFLTIMGLPSLR